MKHPGSGQVEGPVYSLPSIIAAGLHPSAVSGGSPENHAEDQSPGHWLVGLVRTSDIDTIFNSARTKAAPRSARSSSRWVGHVGTLGQGMNQNWMLHHTLQIFVVGWTAVSGGIIRVSLGG